MTPFLFLSENPSTLLISVNPELSPLFNLYYRLLTNLRFLHHFYLIKLI